MVPRVLGGVVPGALVAVPRVLGVVPKVLGGVVPGALVAVPRVQGGVVPGVLGSGPQGTRGVLSARSHIDSAGALHLVSRTNLLTTFELVGRPLGITEWGLPLVWSAPGSVPFSE